jgi:hypothetical protein
MCCPVGAIPLISISSLYLAAAITLGLGAASIGNENVPLDTKIALRPKITTLDDSPLPGSIWICRWRSISRGNGQLRPNGVLVAVVCSLRLNTHL